MSKTLFGVTVVVCIGLGVAGTLLGYDIWHKCPEPPPVECPEPPSESQRYLDQQQDMREIIDETTACNEELLQCKTDMQTALIDGVLRIKDNK